MNLSRETALFNAHKEYTEFRATTHTLLLDTRKLIILHQTSVVIQI